MKKIIFFSFFIIILKYLSVEECASNNNNTYQINTNDASFKYENEFDWTDDDSFKFTVPFIELTSTDGFIPFFINGTVVGNKIYKSGDSIESFTEIFNNIFFPIESFEAKDKNLELTVKSKEVMANGNDVQKKYVKYFGWAQCTDTGKAKITITSIIGTFNNGYYFSLNSILFVGLVLLLI